MNPYEILELQPGASPAEIKEAYHRLAKMWHPDRFTGAEHEAAERRFQQIAQAYGMLRDQAPIPVSKPSGESGQPNVSGIGKDGASIPSPIQKTVDDWIADAKQALKEGNVPQAFGLVDYALRAEPEHPELHKLQVQIQDRPGGDSRKLVQSLEILQRLSPKDVETNIRLAQVYQQVGLSTKATRIWENVRYLDPGHPIFSQGDKPSSGLGDQVQNLGDQAKELVGKLKGLFGKK
ncbi:MAG: J domain-containing protein [Firmicutes bacterium]|nr:J domain-containing protein [Bacillota bacterium]